MRRSVEGKVEMDSVDSIRKIFMPILAKVPSVSGEASFILGDGNGEIQA